MAINMLTRLYNWYVYFMDLQYYKLENTKEL